MDVLRPLFLAVLFLGSQNSNAAIEKKAIVSVTTAQFEKTSDQLEYVARVRSKTNAWVASEIAGEVTKVIRPIGSQVRRGDPILMVKNSDPVHRYMLIKILAPADGVVTTMEVDLLSWVDRGTKLFLVTDPKNLVVDADIPASDLHFLKIGQTSQLLDGSGNSYPLVLRGLSPVVNPKTGMASVELDLGDKVESKLRPGQVARVHFEVNSRNRLVIPESAIIHREGKTFVRILEQGRAKRVPVKIGANLGDRVEVFGGLKPSQQLITGWNRFITDDELVEVQK